MKINQDSKLWLEYNDEGPVKVYLKEPKVWDKKNYLIATPMKNVIEAIDGDYVSIPKEIFEKLVDSYQKEINTLSKQLLKAKEMLDDK